MREMLSANNLSLKDKTVTISGSGNVAIYAAQKAIEQGAKVIAMSDSNGCIHDENGIDLDEINPKTMEVKKTRNLYAIGEILNIDGFCGGFNLQNAWSTAYICAKALS